MCFLRSKWQYTSILIWVLWIRCNPLSTTTAREIDSWTRLVVNLSNIASYYRRLSVKQEIGAFSWGIITWHPRSLSSFPLITSFTLERAKLWPAIGWNCAVRRPATVWKSPEQWLCVNYMQITEPCFHGNTSCGSTSLADFLPPFLLVLTV